MENKNKTLAKEIERREASAEKLREFYAGLDAAHTALLKAWEERRSRKEMSKCC